MRNSHSHPDWWNHRDTEDAENKGDQKQIPRELNDLCHRTIGAAIAVHRELGPGFLESAYEEALSLELAVRQIPHERQVAIPIVYRDRVVAQQRADLLIAKTVLVELKAIESIHAVHVAQLLSYLKAGCFQVGLLINFNVPVLKSGIRRLLWNI